VGKWHSEGSQSDGNLSLIRVGSLCTRCEGKEGGIWSSAEETCCPTPDCSCQRVCGVVRGTKATGTHDSAIRPLRNTNSDPTHTIQPLEIVPILIDSSCLICV
jgi:hypothetical protein